MDSASPLGCMALLEKSHTVAMATFQGEGHVTLLPQHLDQLLTQNHWSCSDLGLIVITIGPGSFAGLRIALGVAKGIHLVHNTPVVAVSNLEALAAGSGIESGWVAVAMDARRGEVFSALYQLEANQPPKLEGGVATQSPELWATTLANLSTLKNQPFHLTGSGLEPYGQVFQNHLGSRFQTVPKTAWLVDPVVLGRLGEKLFKQKGASEITLLEPGYQRRPDAEEKKHHVATSHGR